MTDVNPTFERIHGYVEGDPVVLFMKGTPVFPQCGFSAQVVQVLSLVGVKFKAYDVLADDELRQGIKEFSNWSSTASRPTPPPERPELPGSEASRAGGQRE